MDCFELTIEVEFCAAHILVGHQGKCANLHGHNYKTEVCVIGNKLNSLGMLIDFADLKKAVNDVVNTLDHKYINDIDYPQFIEGQTSAENIAKYVFENVELKINSNEAKVEYVRIWETSKYSVKYSKK
jgi:6-pyruvoyltetrahydropterin/6-carboxytetrahydropterin synthase